MKGNELRIPHVLVIIAGLIALTAIAGAVLPAGSYERDEAGRVVPGTFSYESPQDGEAGARPHGLGLVGAALLAPLEGIVAAADVLAFILVIGGAFKVMESTGAFEAAILAVVRRSARARWLLIPTSMLIFSVGGAVFGMGEEIIPFVLLFVPIARMLGYPAIVGVAVPLVGSQVGFAGAMINPFTVGVAQGIAELPPLSGWEYRTLVWAVVTAFGIGYVVLKGRRLAEATNAREEAAGPLETSMNGARKRVLAVLALSILAMLWGVKEYEWYVLEIGAVFLTAGLLAGAAARLSPNAVAEAFVAGARDLLTAALVVGVARGIVVLALKVGVLDTALHGVAGLIEGVPGTVALSLMFLFQTLLNFFIPSGSGQAALTMPIMAPLAELVGLTRQMAVLAFQLGDGFSNLIVPTSAVLMGSLEAGKVRYKRWFAFAWPLQLWLFTLGVLFLAGAVAQGYGP